MNIFVTDPDPVVCARQHCDVHLRKMIVETAQLLSAAHIVIDGVQVAYKKTHHHHPCAVWVQTSASNYRWAFALLVAQLDEYEYRFARTHKTRSYVDALSRIPSMPDLGLTPFAMAMPEELRSTDVFKSYRRYLKRKLLSWREREKPVRTQFTCREVPRYLASVSGRLFPCIQQGVHHVASY